MNVLNNRMRKNLVGALSLPLLLLMIVTGTVSLYGQGSTATVIGTVTDSSGAVIAGAAVAVKNTGTGAVRNVTTDEQGRYRAPDLLIGQYEIEGSNAGFQTVVRRGITLTTGAELVVDFSLQVGQVQDTVTIDGQMKTVATQTASLGTLVESTQMRELPLNGRSYTQLMALNPAVTQITDGAPGSAGGFAGQGTRYAISGSRPNGQAWIL